MTWLVTTRENGVHVVPVDDLRDHEFSEDCWCNPRIEEDVVIVHSSADERELYERGEKKPS